jgi:hypothetical protein
LPKAFASGAATWTPTVGESVWIAPPAAGGARPEDSTGLIEEHDNEECGAD